MDHQQFEELARHVQIRGIFSTAAFVVGLIMVFVISAWAYKAIKNSDFDSGDRALAFGLGGAGMLGIMALLIFGICCYGPDIFAPKGEVVKESMNRFPYNTIKINVNP